MLGGSRAERRPIVATKTSGGVVNITEADQRLITVDEVRQFGERLYKALLFAETAEMRLSRLDMAHSLDGLGGWPEGYTFSAEAVAAFALLADDLEREAGRMQTWATNVRELSCHLWWVRGPGVPDDAR